jgi:phospholipid/cholesterol/gamma-HCH transport system ATP-binding protein
MNAPATVIEIEGLCTRFGAQVVHRDIDLAVRRGEVLTLVGGSGSGKTTLLRQILGLERPSAGRVKVFGVDLAGAGEQEREAVRARWGVLFQGGALFSALSVFDNVALPLRELRRLGEDMIERLVMLKLQKVGIEAQHRDKMPAQLSGGMVKRVALARAIALEPELLFLDEPTAGLDPEASDDFVGLVESLRAGSGLTVVMVTHDLDTLAALSDRVAILASSRLVSVGTLDETLALDAPFVRDFFLGWRGRRALLSRSAAVDTGGNR